MRLAGYQRILTQLTVTASNNEMAKVATTFIHLKLVLDKGNGQLESVPMGGWSCRGATDFCALWCVELSIAQFYQFLQEMEKAKSIIDFLG